MSSSFNATEERRATMRIRREQQQQNRNARRSGGDMGYDSNSGSGDYSAAAGGRGGRLSNKNLGDKPLVDAVYSTSLRTLGHSIDGKVIFTTSNLPAMGLTSLRPVAQLGTQLQRIIVDNNALESLEDLQDCVSLVHLSAIGNKLEHGTSFPHLVNCANTLNYLNLSDNRIASLQGVEKLRFLVTLTLDGNQLTSLEVEGTSEEAMLASANESCNEHCSALLDDVMKAIDETNARGKPRSRRGSMHEPLGREGSNLSRGASMFESNKRRGSHIAGIARAKDTGEEQEATGPSCSPLRFLVSLWRFSAANNEIKEVRPAVFERCPLRLLNLSNNSICDLDFCLPLHKSLMVLTLDGNDISHLPASAGKGSGGGGIRRLGSRHMGDSVHQNRAVHHPEVGHLNFQMMSTLVSLNLGRNNIASFNEISEMRHLPQLRQLTLAQCTLCSLPTAADLNLREDALKKKRLDGVRNDHDLGSTGLDPTALTADRIAAATKGRQSGGGGGGDEDDGFQSGIFGPRADTVRVGDDHTAKGNSRKPSMVVINSPSMVEFGSGFASESISGPSNNASGTFTVEALIRPDDAEAVTFRTPEEQDAVEFNKRTTEERYRLKVLMHVPQLQTLDGVACTTEDIAEAQQLAGGYLREERTRAIAKYIKPAGGSAGAALRKMLA